MGISTVVQWWEEWQLRILVLSSLVVQWFLFISAIRRKHVISHWSIRSFIWLVYVGSDYLAITALAALFSSQQNYITAGANNRGTLELVWVPILLVHLGGQDCITAYDIENNELWKQHILTSVSQITVAIYIFCKSWPTDGDKNLLYASILVFIPGILKCLEKPWALKSASINSLVSSSNVPASYRKDESNTLEEYVQKAKMIVNADGQFPRENPRPPSVWFEIYQPSKLFVDLASPYTNRIDTLQSFWTFDETNSYASLQLGIYATFDLLYTKIKMTTNIFTKGENQDPDWLQFLAAFVRIWAYSLSFISMVLLLSSDTKSYDGNDVKVTYVLLYCTVALESFSFWTSAMCALSQEGEMETILPGIEGPSEDGLLEFFGINQMYNTIMPIVSSFFGGNQMHTIIRPIVSFFKWDDRERSSEVAQYSLVGFFGSNQRHKIIRPIVSFFKCEDLLYQLWCMKPCHSSKKITSLVVEHVKKGWNEEIHDAAGYRKFNNCRGQLTLGANQQQQQLGWSLRRSFDESVLLWHIATDVCFYASPPHQDADYDPHGQAHADWCKKYPNHKIAVRCREISQYMMYLLFVNPEMLLDGTRQNLFTAANVELEKIHIHEGQNPLPNELTIIYMLHSWHSRPQEQPEGFFHGAMNLADALCSIGDEKKTWEVIQGVWVEMLCYSASRSRGYLHAKSLGAGGEFLTYVWLLLSHMGMVTLPERLQGPEMEIPSME